MTGWFDPGDLAMDRELSDISDSFRFLLDVTPINVGEMRREFSASLHAAPAFRYRELEEDPDIAGVRLDSIDPGRASDPALAQLFEAKRREMVLRLAMLRARGSDGFLPLSIELYGTVTPDLLQQAQAILAEPFPHRGKEARWVDARSFAARAERELDHYRRIEPDLSAHVEIRDDCGAVMVSRGDLLIPSTVRVFGGRVNALLQHEIGTHVLTYFNGGHQPLRLLAVGLAGYEETQEGVALLAEYLVGELTAARLRQVAARVVAVHRLLEDGSFGDAHRELVDVHRFAPADAFEIVMRIYRSGGLTKDAIYLRGFNQVLGYLREGRPLITLWLGKFSMEAAPLIADLWRRGALNPPRLLPRFLGNPGVEEKVDQLRELGSVTELVRA